MLARAPFGVRVKLKNLRTNRLAYLRANPLTYEVSKEHVDSEGGEERIDTVIGSETNPRTTTTTTTTTNDCETEVLIHSFIHSIPVRVACRRKRKACCVWEWEWLTKRWRVVENVRWNGTGYMQRTDERRIVPCAALRRGTALSTQ